MHLRRLWGVVIGVLIMTQILSPVGVWAAEQRGIQVEANRSLLVSGLSGEAFLARVNNQLKTLQFRDRFQAGEPLTTDGQTTAEVLIGERAVVTLGPNTAAQFTAVSMEQTTLQVTLGQVRVAAAPSGLGEQGRVTIETPTGQVQTRGGIVRVVVGAPTGSAEGTPTGVTRPYGVSYTPESLLAARAPQSAIILVEEGAADVIGTGAKGVTVPAGQSLRLEDGKAGALTAFAIGEGLRPSLMATGTHSQTPPEGLEHLVTLQVAQATALGNALVGAEETTVGETQNTDESKNAIIGTTGGVILANQTLVSALFGAGNAANIQNAGVVDSSGTGYGGHNSSGFSSGNFPEGVSGVSIPTNGGNALLVYTRKMPVDQNLQPLQRINSTFSIEKELVLAGASLNDWHGGAAPEQPEGKLIIRGLAPVPGNTTIANVSIYPSDVNPLPHGDPAVEIEKAEIVKQNSTFVVQKVWDVSSGPPFNFSGGTLGQFSNRPDGVAFIKDDLFAEGTSYIDGAITATGSNIVLTGGVTLDHGTVAMIESTSSTSNFFSSNAVLNNPNQVLSSAPKYNGSLMSVIRGPSDTPTMLTMQDRMVGIYDGSEIKIDAGNKALLSVLDARLVGPATVPLIEIDAAFVDDGITSGAMPVVNVTSAVVTRSTIKLDGALLEASGPLLALTRADMTTTSHFADLAGNQNQALVLNNALVALNASKLVIQNGNLLNLNAATATVNGYLFSLNNGSTLQLNNGMLFSLSNGSALTLNSSAFGVFGSGANALAITNNLCTAGCGLLVNSANQPFVLPNGTSLKVAGVTNNVVLPNNFNVFATSSGAPPPNVNVAANAALFRVDSTSTLTINGTPVVKK